MDRKGVCRNCGQRGHWTAECPKRGKNGQGGKGEDGKRRANQVKGKLMMARRKAKAKVTSGKHARHLKGIAIKFGSGVTWRRIVSQKPRPRVKAKVWAISMNLKQVDQKTFQLADLICARLETVIMLTGCGTIYRKVTFTFDSGAAVSVAPESLGDDDPMQIEEPRLYKTATGEPVQDEGFRVSPIVTEKGVASLHES